MTTLEVLSSSPLSTVQDGGRRGVMGSGFSQNGAMDLYSMHLANCLVGNCLDCAVIEMTMIGLSVKFSGECIIALCGGDFSPELSGAPIQMNKAYSVKSGQVLECKTAKCGARCYLAASGGIEVPCVMGSMSTDLKCQTGGYCGRKLCKGDILTLGSDNLELTDINKCQMPYAPIANEHTVRAILGPQDDMFTQDDIKMFFSQKYTVNPSSDRMGVRLDGKPLAGKGGMDIISDGIVLGSVQVPSSGMPIVLTADHQTTGGYAKIATVISVDIPCLAQAKPGDTIRFVQTDLKTAQKLAKKEKAFFKKLVF